MSEPFIHLNRPDRPPRLLVLALTEPEEARALPPLLEGASEAPWALVCVSPGDWNRDLSPWPAPAVFRGGGDFAGGAGLWLESLREALPGLRERLGCPEAPCALAGYSLAGLFALWSLYACGDFAGAASVSGSLWYPGFLDFARSRALPGAPRIYLSLGDAEARTRNPVMARVEECTRQLAAHYQALGLDTLFEMNPGNHFREPTRRLARGIRWLLGDDRLKENAL